VADLLGSREHHVIVVCISETFLKPDLRDDLVFIEGYKIIRNDRTGKGAGGVAMYIRDDLKFKILNATPSFHS